MKQDTRMIHQQKRGKNIRTISAKHYRGKERHTIIPDDIARSVYKTRNTVWLPKESGATGLIIRRWRQSVHAQRNASTESFLRWKPNLVHYGGRRGHESEEGRKRGSSGTIHQTCLGHVTRVGVREGTRQLPLPRALFMF